MIVAAVALLVYGFNSFGNYSRKKPNAKEEGLYWANLISTLLRISIFIGSLMLTLDFFASDSAPLLANAQREELAAYGLNSEQIQNMTEMQQFFTEKNDTFYTIENYCDKICEVQTVNVTVNDTQGNSTTDVQICYLDLNMACITEYFELTYDVELNYEAIDFTYFFKLRADTPFFEGIGAFTDYGSLICIISSVLVSYLSISAVRLQYQVPFMVVPIFLSMVLVNVFLFLIPFLDHDTEIDGKLGPVTLGQGFSTDLYFEESCTQPDKRSHTMGY